jgi:DNA polymerase
LTAAPFAKCSFTRVFWGAHGLFHQKRAFSIRLENPTFFASLPVIDPADAIEVLLDELKRQRALGVNRVSVSAESLEFLRKVSGAARPAAAPAASAAPARPAPVSPVSAFTASAQAARPAAAPAPVRPVVVKPAGTPAAAPVAPIPEPPVVALPAGDKIARLAALQAMILACPETHRHLLAKNQKPVLGHGSVDARIFFVGEAPTLEETEAGRPFVGPSGELLRKILAAGAIGEELIYLAPVMGWRPEPPTPLGKRPPNARELAFNLPYLRAQIEIVRPQAIVALGAQACEALHPGGPPITQARGKWLDFQGIPLMPTFHPNYLLHNPSATAKRTAWEDFLLIMEKVGLPISDKQRAYFTAK